MLQNVEETKRNQITLPDASFVSKFKKKHFFLAERQTRPKKHCDVIEKNVFCRVADKIKESIEEMDTTDMNHVIIYESKDDLTTVQQQQMELNGTEIDLTALNDEVTDGDESRLTNLHPKQGQSTFQSPKVMNKSLSILSQKVRGFYLFGF